MHDKLIERAASAIYAADAILFTAGAGMGVDSGLPDFRGAEGFWKAYPPLAKLGIDFMDAANPHLFEERPHLAWAFYGHRYNLYSQTQPHVGYRVQRRIAAEREHFVYTSNVDDAYVKAGFDPDRCVDCHGNIFYWQTTAERSDLPIWEARPESGHEVHVDLDAFQALDPLPRAPDGSLARPNVLMFGDWSWDGTRTSLQEARLYDWLEARSRGETVIIECGAGTAIPSVRNFGRRLRRSLGATLIRINPTDSHGGTLCLPLKAAEAMTRIEQRLEAWGFFKSENS